MNAGFSNLTTLKAWLLPSGLRDGTDYDDFILKIGLGVAAQFEKWCNRQFARAADATFDFSGERAHIVVPRFPIEAVTKIEVRQAYSEPFVDQGAIAGLVANISEQAGLIDFGVALATYRDRVRVTYTGGYFWDVSEDPDTPDVQPVGSADLPHDIRSAWLLQCSQTWSKLDKLGLTIGQEPKADAILAQIEQIPGVIEMLRPFVRQVLL